VGGKLDLQKPFVGIIGPEKSGKSTLTKSLTGCPTNSYRGFLSDRHTGETLLIICDSPQEKSLTLADLRTMLKRAADDPSCRGVVIAIQPKSTRTRLSMEKIFEEARRHNFQLNAFIIDPGYNGSSADSRNISSRLHHLPVRIEGLDGRRFAAVNVRIINDTTDLIARPAGEVAISAAAGDKK
jgi:energy-coupling factor transporter ATP-binding protein EcfA2